MISYFSKGQLPYIILYSHLILKNHVNLSNIYFYYPVVNINFTISTIVIGVYYYNEIIFLME